MPFDSNITEAPRTAGSAIPPGVTLIPHTDDGRAFMRAVLRNLGPAGRAYRGSIEGLRECLTAYRRVQKNAAHSRFMQERFGAGYTLGCDVKGYRERVRSAIADARRCRAALIVGGAQ